MPSTELIKLEVNVPVKMRDGTVLYADIWRPGTGGKYPAILTRTPYNNNLMFPTRSGYLNTQRFARAGYATTLWCPSDRVSKDVFTAIQGYLADIGIKADLQALNPGQFAQMYFATGWTGGIFAAFTPISLTTLDSRGN